ncbi:MAG TPA: PEP-CTERM sorting domain-containing protein [Thermoguttaceae bacterium]|nr:PEP-CTERM sorting domain-containing protein [Thermoguttaceae bacterium]
MKRASIGFAVVVLLVATAPVEGSVAMGDIAVSGSGDVTSVYDGNVTFTGYGTLSATIINKTLDAFGDMLVTVTYDSSDIDFSFKDSGGALRSGLRWGEVITNDTGLPWESYSISLGGTNGHEFVVDSSFSGGYIPNFADITGLATGPVNVTLMSPATMTSGAGGITIAGVDGSLLVSPDRTTLTFDFAVPLAPSSSFGVWISPLLTVTSGNFALTQSASPVPEPATLGIWSFGIIGLAVGWWRRRGKAV